jgi:hypothetical protein
MKKTTKSRAKIVEKLVKHEVDVQPQNPLLQAVKSSIERQTKLS